VHAQQLTVSADKNPAFIGEQILIKYSIDVEAKDFKSPSFNGLRILSGPNPSKQSYTNIINGKYSSRSSITYSYSIQAVKEGAYNISPATIMVNGNAIKSKAYTLIVKKGNKQNTTEQNKKTTFITVTASKKSVFIGEPFSVIYSLYIEEGTRFQVSKIFPLIFNNFSEEIIEVGSPKKDIVNGIRYDVHKYRHSILTPQKSGEQTISPSQIDLSIISNGKLLGHDLFGRALYDQKITPRSLFSKSLTIDVRKIPLPKPDNFYNLVGYDVSIKSKIWTDSIKSPVDTLTTKSGEIISYEVTIKAKGNINKAEVFPVEFPKEFTVMKNGIYNKTAPYNKGITGRKVFKYTLIPRAEGVYIIPPFTYSYFDVKKEEYVLLQTEEYTINVLPSDLKDSIDSPKEGNLELQTEANLTKIEDREKWKKYYAIFFYSIMLLITLLVLYYLYTTNKTINPINEKRRKATKIAIKRLKTANKCILNNNFELFFEEIEKSLWGYFGQKFNVESSKLSKENITIYFSSNNIEKELEKEFIDLIQHCEFARYAPSSNKNMEMKQTLERAKEIIIKVETNIKIG
tara:strand:+ start:214 stop:1929 length:1716 start_codon:yes stop_codon:yes gene_type:complete